MRKLAFAFLEIKPSDFMELTINEFNEMIDALKLRDERDWRKVAQLASWVTAPHLRKPVSPDKLLGKNKGGRNENATTPEQSANVIAELEAQMKSRANK